MSRSEICLAVTLLFCCMLWKYLWNFTKPLILPMFPLACGKRRKVYAPLMNPAIIRAGLLMCFFANVAQARSYDDVMGSGYIEFAVYSDFAPYSFLNGDVPEGIDIDIGKAIAERMGLEARWMWIVADETVDDDLRNAIWKGHVVHKRVADVMLRAPYDRNYSYAVDGYGLPRNDMVVMLAPYQVESWKLLRNLDKTGEVRNLSIFQYQPVGVEIDTVPDFFLSGVYQGRLRKSVQHFPSVFAAIDAFKQGRLSAVAGMRAQLEYGLGADRQAVFDIDDDGMQGMGKMQWDIGIAIKHTYRQLGYALEAVIRDMVTDGSIEKLYTQRHITYQKPDFYQSLP